MQAQDVLTVGALMDALKDQPKDAAVILSSDAEGNQMHMLDGIDPEASWNVRTNELALDYGGDFSPIPPNGKSIRKAIILFPEH